MLNIIPLTVGAVATNCYLAFDADTREAAVIDPGDNAAAILACIQAEKVQVKIIFLTHGHFDHVLAADEIRRATGAPIAIHEADTTPGVPYMLPVNANILLHNGDKHPIGSYIVETLHTPGHTPGSVCLRVGDILFTGDTLFEDDCGRCDLPGGDYTAMLHSLRTLAALEGDYTVYPGHDVPTTLERERRCNGNMREALGIYG